jgi:hypothetical protein
MSTDVPDLTHTISVNLQAQLARLEPDIAFLRANAVTQEQLAQFRSETKAAFEAAVRRIDDRIDNTNMHVVGMDNRLSIEISALRGMIQHLLPKPRRRRRAQARRRS